MNAPNAQPCRSPYRLYIDGIPRRACKCHWMTVDTTLVTVTPQQASA